MAAEGRIPISQRTTIVNPGSYIVTEDISTATGNAITINTDNVSIDLDGHTVRSTTGYGFWGVNEQTDIKIFNGFVIAGGGGVSFYSTTAGFYYVENLNVTINSSSPANGIEILGTSSNAIVTGCKVTRTLGIRTGAGILYNQSYGNIENNKVTNFQTGINLYTSNNVFVERNYCGKNQYGMYMTSAIYNTIRNNIFSENTGSGLHANTIGSGADFNTITDNSVSGNTNYGIYLNSVSDENNIDRNTAACSSTNGIYIGGCGNIYSNNKTPGVCTIFLSTSCGANPNINGGGNTP